MEDKKNERPSQKTVEPEKVGTRRKKTQGDSESSGGSRQGNIGHQSGNSRSTGGR